MKQLVAMVLLAGSTARGAAPVRTQESCVRWADYYAHVYQVPVELVDAVIEVESDWNPDAVSPKGAVGLMQLMPATAVRFGVWNRFQLQENVRAGVAYLAWLIRLFHGDLRLATAAYLLGESRVESRGLAYSSPEVYSYVSRVARIYRARRLNAMRRHETAEEVER